MNTGFAFDSNDAMYVKVLKGIGGIFAGIILGPMACSNEPDTPPPTAPTINDITVTGAGSPTNGKYTVSYTAEVMLGGNTETAGNTYAWSYVTNPASAAKNLSFTPGTTAANVTVSGFEQGVEYTLALTITNQANLTSTKNVTIAVAANQAPTADAGSDDTIKLPITSYTLNGSGTDPEDGTNVTYDWTVTGKPNGAADPTFDNATNANPTVSGLNTLGDYTFQLIVTDTAGNASAPATVKITVQEADPINYDITINLAAINLTGGVTSIDLTPSYAGITGLTGTFTSTLAETDETGTPTNYFNIDGNTISFPGGFTGHPWPPPPLITQTFYYNGDPIGSFSFNLRAQSVGGGISIHTYLQI